MSLALILYIGIASAQKTVTLRVSDNSQLKSSTWIKGTPVGVTKADKIDVVNCEQGAFIR